MIKFLAVFLYLAFQLPVLLGTFHAQGGAGAVVQNWALQSNGGSASASNTGVGSVAAINDGLRHTNGSWTVYGYKSAFLPVTVEIDFGQTRSISSITVISMGETLDYGTDPTIGETSTYATMSFTVDYWNGSSWVNVGTASGTNTVISTFNFAAADASKIRFVATSANYSNVYLAEIEVSGY